MAVIDLPRNGAIERYELRGDPVPLARRRPEDFPRIVYGAAHVVADPLADNDPWLTPAIDWERTFERAELIVDTVDSSRGRSTRERQVLRLGAGWSARS